MGALMSTAVIRFCLPAVFLLALAACSGTDQTQPRPTGEVLSR